MLNLNSYNFRLPRVTKNERTPIQAIPITSMYSPAFVGLAPKIVMAKSIIMKKMVTNPVGPYLMFLNPYKIPAVPVQLRNPQSKIRQ